MVSVLPAIYRTYSTTTRKSSAAKCFAWERVRRKRLGKGQFVVPPPSRESSLGPAWSAASGEDREHFHHAAPSHSQAICLNPSARLRSAA
jgi:hypothetical protein